MIDHDDRDEATDLEARATRAKSVIVYGRPGCGKTSNAERMRTAMGLDEVIDDWGADLACAGLPPFGALILTSALPSKVRPALRAKGWTVMSFDEAMQAVFALIDFSSYAWSRSP